VDEGFADLARGYPYWPYGLDRTLG